MTLKSFLIDYGPYILISIISVTWKLWAPIVFAHTFNKKLAQYKTDLETEKEKALADYGKGITGFNKFFDKKYEVYPILYGSIIKLHGELSDWAPKQYFPDFEILTEDEFNDYIEEFGFSSPDRRKLIDKKQHGAISAHDIYILLPQHIHRCIAETNNYFLEHRLFLSEEIDSLVERFLKKTVQILSGYRNVCTGAAETEQWDLIESTNKDNEMLIMDLLHQMKAELEHGTPNQE